MGGLRSGVVLPVDAMPDHTPVYFDTRIWNSHVTGATR
jgi:hypothetical protein